MDRIYPIFLSFLDGLVIDIHKRLGLALTGLSTGCEVETAGFENETTRDKIS